MSFSWSHLDPTQRSVFVWDQPSLLKKRIELKISEQDHGLKFVTEPISLEKLKVFPPYFPWDREHHGSLRLAAPALSLTFLGFLVDDQPEEQGSNSSLVASTSSTSSGTSVPTLSEPAVLIEIVVENCSKVLRIRNIQDVFQDLENRDSLRQRMEEYRRAIREQQTQEAASASSQQVTALAKAHHPSMDTKLVDLTLNLAGIGISLINQVPRELAYIRLDQISVQYIETFKRQSVELKLSALKIDNQLPLTPFPLLMRSRKVEGKPFFHVSVIRSMVHQTVQFFHYFGIGLQEMDIMLDEIFLLELLGFSVTLLKYFQRRSGLQAEKSILALQAQTHDLRSSAALHEPSQKVKPVLLYFELLQMNSIQANLSFITVPGGHTRLEQFGPIFDFLLDLGGVVANLDNAPLQLNGMMWKNPLLSLENLSGSLRQHYLSQMLLALGRLLGSADAIGNPKALFTGLGTGFKDFFVEPAQGIVSSPLDFGVGIAKGTSSLFKNTVYSLSKTTQKPAPTIHPHTTPNSL